MKVGDTVWYYDDRACGIYESTIVSVEIVEEHRFFIIFDYPSAVAYSNIFDGKPPVMRISMDRCFPTKDALCEHYRKIFE